MPGTEPTIGIVRSSADPTLGALLKRLAKQAGDLARQEAELAKTELRQSARTTARGAALLAAGGVLFLLGALVLTAFLVLLIGELIGAYWPAALGVAILYLLAGSLLALRAKSVFGKHSLAPADTLRSLAADREWAQAEVEQAKRRLA